VRRLPGARCGRSVGGRSRPSGGVDLDHAVEVADVDAQLEGRGGHDEIAGGVLERVLGPAAVVAFGDLFDRLACVE